MSDLQSFGPVTDAVDVENAILKTLQEWAPTYLRLIERHHGLKVGQLGEIESWTVSSDEDHFAEEKLPAILVASRDVENVKLDGAGIYRGTFPITIGVFCKARDRKSTERLAKFYTAAMRELVIARGSFGGLASGYSWRGEAWDTHVNDELQRTFGAGEVRFDVEVRNLGRRYSLPLEPILTEPPALPTVTQIDGVDFVAVELDAEFLPESAFIPDSSVEPSDELLPDEDLEPDLQQEPSALLIPSEDLEPGE